MTLPAPKPKTKGRHSLVVTRSRYVSVAGGNFQGKYYHALRPVSDYCGSWRRSRLLTEEFEEMLEAGAPGHWRCNDQSTTDGKRHVSGSAKTRFFEQQFPPVPRMRVMVP